MKKLFTILSVICIFILWWTAEAAYTGEISFAQVIVQVIVFTGLLLVFGFNAVTSSSK